VTIATLARMLAPRGSWMRHLPRHPLLAPTAGALLGFALPACECGNVPVAKRLLADGAPLGTALGFLFAAPVLNPIVLLSTWAAFPDRPWLLLARPGGAFLLALLLSTVLPVLSESRLLVPDLLAQRRLAQPLSQVGLLERNSGLVGTGLPMPAPPPSRRADWRTELQHASAEFLGLASLLLLGCAIAAVVQTWLPRSWLLSVGSDPTLSVVALMLLALVVSVCSSVDAFLALGFAAQVTPGALLAFLLLGPVVDLKLAGLFTVLLRPVAIGVTAVAALLAVLLMGQWVNLWLL
jgi:uncharacterized membrane protein YraQ (UPF0718 family)